MRKKREEAERQKGREPETMDNDLNTMNYKSIALALGVVIAGGVGFLFFDKKDEATAVAEKKTPILETLVEEDQLQKKQITVKVVYTADGFSPKTIPEARYKKLPNATVRKTITIIPMR